jgi:hypothetical protein
MTGSQGKLKNYTIMGYDFFGFLRKERRMAKDKDKKDKKNDKKKKKNKDDKKDKKDKK